MPTFRHGKRTVVLLNGTDMSPFLNEATQTDEIEVAETTTFADADKTYMMGLTDGTISTSGLFDATAGASDAVLRGLIADDDNTFTVLPEGATAGTRSIIANGQLTSYEISSPVGDVVAISAEIQADGGLFSGRALNGLTNSGTSASLTSVDWSAGTVTGGLFNLHLVSNTRDGAATVRVQHSVDNSTWVDLVSFTSISASTVSGESITSTGTVNRYLRAAHTLAGSSGSITYHVSAARR
jgi:hypothetical protein